MDLLGNVGYGVASVAFLFLLLLVLVNWRNRNKDVFLLVATALTVVWAAILSIDAMKTVISIRYLLLLDIVRSLGWLWVLLDVLSVKKIFGLSRRRLFSVTTLLAVFFGSYLLITPSLGGTLLSHMPIQVGVAVGALGIALAGLFLLEQLYRNADPARRWSLKFLCLGIGLMFAFDLYLYSMLILYRTLDGVAWLARGPVVVLAVPLLMVAIRRNPNWSLNIFVSRQAVVYTASLMGVGIYLTAMALGGYYIRIYGGSWGIAAQTIFLFGAGLALLLLLFSGSLRAKLRVFVGKHFYQNKYDYREVWLRFTRVLSESGDEDNSANDRILIAAGGTIDSHAGALWVREDGSNYAIFGSWNMPVEPEWYISADSPLVKFLANKDWVIDTLELRENPSLYGNLELPDWFSHVTSGECLISPLYSGGSLLGVMVLIRPPHFDLTWEDTDLIRTVAQQAASHVAQTVVQRRLAENSQFEAYNRLVSFMMHDLKNLIAQQVMVVKNAARHKDNPDFVDDMISTVDNSVKRMNHLLLQLRPEHTQTRNLATASEVVASAIEGVSAGKPTPQLTIDEDGKVAVDPSRLTMIVRHVLRNAQDATADSGSVKVRIFAKNGQVGIEVKDTGVGMDIPFQQNRLFQPFFSTKGSKGMGIGAYQSRQFVRDAGGDVLVESAPGQGTTFTLCLPEASAGDEGGSVTLQATEK